MLRRSIPIHALALVVVVALAGPAAAEPHVRDGFFAGFGFGGGWASVVIADDRQPAEWSGTLSARAGWALDQDLLLGAEYTRWAKDDEIARLEGDIPVKLTFSSVVPAVTFFPGNVGFKIRGGAGLAMATIEAYPPAGVEFALDGKKTYTGIAALFAFGYEARVTTRFAFGADFGFNYLAIDEIVAEDVFIYGLDLQLNWYW
jgi:hypothetical protein